MGGLCNWMTLNFDPVISIHASSIYDACDCSFLLDTWQSKMQLRAGEAKLSSPLPSSGEEAVGTPRACDEKANSTTPDVPPTPSLSASTVAATAPASIKDSSGAERSIKMQVNVVYGIMEDEKSSDDASTSYTYSVPGVTSYMLQNMT